MARRRTSWSATMLSAVLTISVLGTPSVATAQSEPVFHLPFPCDQLWGASTYDDHWFVAPGNEYPVDFNRVNEKGESIADRGMEVLAGADRGVVTVVDERDDYGHYVKIAYPGGVELLFAHLAERSPLPKDQKVDSQTIVGKVGESGRAFGSHLHYEQRVNGVPRKVELEGRTLSIAPVTDPMNGDIAWSPPGVVHTSKNCGTPSSDASTAQASTCA